MVQWRLSRKKTVIKICQEFEEDFKSPLTVTKKKGEMYDLPTRHWYYHEDPNREEHEYYKHQQKYKPCIRHTSFKFKLKSSAFIVATCQCVSLGIQDSCVSL